MDCSGAGNTVGAKRYGDYSLSFSFPGSSLGMPVFSALAGLGGTGILPVIDRRDACLTASGDFHCPL